MISLVAARAAVDNDGPNIVVHGLALTKKEAAVIQLEAWPFRDAKPRNLAGWMIQAIEGNYQAPLSYLDEKRKRKERERLEDAQTEKSACAICNGSGFRNIKSVQYPKGAMRECTHDPAIESEIPSELAA